MSFNILERQPEAVSMLKAAFKNRKPAHAFLFTGPAGSGQSEAADELAKMLFCRHPKGPEPCGICSDCRLIERRSHPDCARLEPGEAGGVISVDAIRALGARAALKPFQAPAKVFVIEEAERMNDTAQNAFLKTLEEPPAQTYFILICPAPERLLPTVRSRVQTLNFLPVIGPPGADEETLAAYRPVLEFALGRLGVCSPCPRPDLGGLERAETAGLMDTLIGCFRDILLIRVGAEQVLKEIAPADLKKKAADILPEDEIIRIIEIFSETRQKIAENVNVKLALSVLWDSLRAA